MLPIVQVWLDPREHQVDTESITQAMVTLTFDSDSLSETLSWTLKSGLKVLSHCARRRALTRVNASSMEHIVFNVSFLIARVDASCIFMNQL